MTDVHSPEVRSYNMSRIRNKDTKPEVAFRTALHRAGFRYTKNDKRLPGKPDLVLKKYNAVILIRRCFWHGHENCDYFRLPKSNTAFWKDKIGQTQIRDIKKCAELETAGWRVLTIWECSIKTVQQVAKKSLMVGDWLRMYNDKRNNPQ